MAFIDNGDAAEVEPTDMSSNTMSVIRRTVQRLASSRGTREAPAKTCRDLAASNPQLPSGMYWIDPNQGSSSDAFEAFCDMTTRQTCILAKPAQVGKGKKHVGKRKRVWFSTDIDKGFTFTYIADSSQMTHLQALSTRAYQNITYHCLRSVAYYDTTGQTYNKAAMFTTWDDQEVENEGKRFSYTVSKDECKDRPNTWAQTVFEFNMNKPSRLPIEDIGMNDLGKKNQEFGLDIGPVCFS